DGAVVQWIDSIAYPQKARALLKGLRPHQADLFQLFPRGKSSVLRPVIHDIFCQRSAKPRYIGQQMLARRIQIDTHVIHTTLHYAIQLLFQFVLIHIMLVLSEPDRLGVYLHQLTQGIQKPAADTHGPAYRYILVGELLPRDLTRRIDRSPALIDHEY